MVPVPCGKKKPYSFPSSCTCPDHQSVTVLTTLHWKVIPSLENLPCKKLSGSLSVHSVSLRLPEDTLPQLIKFLRLVSEAEVWLCLGRVWELSWEWVSWKPREAQVSWMLRINCPGGHSTACKCCQQAEIQWDWRMLQLEADRSQLGIHTNPSSISSVW